VLLRAEDVNSCEPDALDALRNTQLTKMHGGKRNERDSIMHTLTGAKLLKLIAVKLADRNAGEVERKTLHWNDGAHTKRKIFNVSRNKSLKPKPLLGLQSRHLANLQTESTRTGQEILQRIYGLIVDAYLVV
jgi:hypothetical protein